MEKVVSYLTNFLKVQAIVTIASFPILVAWGLPLSLMTFVGNFIFTPFLTVFLLLSSLIFFTELFSIPNTILISALAYTTSWWEYALSFGKKSWLIGFAIPFITPTPPPEGLEVVRAPNKTIQLIDLYCFSQKRSPEKFVIYELSPYLIKTYGTTTIDAIFLYRPSARALRAVRKLYNTFTINELAVAYFPGRLSRYGWKLFYELKEMIERDGGRFTRFRPDL